VRRGRAALKPSEVSILPDDHVVEVPGGHRAEVPHVLLAPVAGRRHDRQP
jgi:hypothetical protein